MEELAFRLLEKRHERLPKTGPHIACLSEVNVFRLASFSILCPNFRTIFYLILSSELFFFLFCLVFVLFCLFKEMVTFKN